MGNFLHPQNNTKPSASHHPFTHHPPCMLGFQPAPCLASSAPSIFSLPLHKHLWGFSQVPPMCQGRSVERTLRNFVTLFKVFLKLLSLPGELQKINAGRNTTENAENTKFPPDYCPLISLLHLPAAALYFYS